MATAATGGITMTSNATRIIQKLEPKVLLGGAPKMLLQKGVEEGLAYLKPITPVLTGKSVSQEHVSITEISASILAPSHPLIFLERGSQTHIGPKLADGSSSRSHRKKSAKAFSSGLLRIQGRHFLRRTKAWTVKNLQTKLIPAAAKDIENRWGQA